MRARHWIGLTLVLVLLGTPVLALRYGVVLVGEDERLAEVGSLLDWEFITADLLSTGEALTGGLDTYKVAVMAGPVGEPLLSRAAAYQAAGGGLIILGPPQGLEAVYVGEINHELVHAVETLGQGRLLGQVMIPLEEWPGYINDLKILARRAEREFRSAEGSFAPLTEQTRRKAQELLLAMDVVEDALRRGQAHRIAPYYQIAQRHSQDLLIEVQQVRGAEARGIWIDYQTIEASTPAGLRRMMERLHAANINIIFPETYYMGVTIHPTEVGIQNPVFAGWDPLAVLVEEAHRLGMEIHPWVWVFCAGYWHELSPILQANPHWTEIDERGEPFSNNEVGMSWLNPTLPEVRQYLKDLYTEILTGYDVHGLHIDYIRYQDTGFSQFGYSSYSQEVFQADTGLDLRQIRRGTREWEIFNQWRRGNVTSFVGEVAQLIKGISPDLLLSAAVFPDPNHSYEQVLQEWPLWVQSRYFDFMATMIYDNDMSYFTSMAQSGLNAVKDQIWLLPSPGLYTIDRWSNMAQIRAIREMGATGISLFSVLSFTGDKYRDTQEGLFREPAIIPFRQPIESIRVLLEEALLRLELAEVDTVRVERIFALTWEERPLVELMDELAAAIMEVMDDLDELRRTRVLRTQGFKGLMGPLTTAHRITQIYLYQNQ